MFQGPGRSIGCCLHPECVRVGQSTVAFQDEAAERCHPIMHFQHRDFDIMPTVANLAYTVSYQEFLGSLKYLG